MLKSLVSGAKRGFSDAIDGGSGKWVLSGNGGSDVGLCKDGNLFSPKAKGVGVGECNNQQNPFSAASVVKETVPHSPKPLHDNKPQISSAPSAK
jgi:auxin-responsive protein IAA